MMRAAILGIVVLAGLVTGEVTPPQRAVEDGPRVAGVLVDQTRGSDPGVLASARAEVARLEASGADAQLRVTASPSQTTGAVATLVALGADRVVAYGADVRLLPAALRAHVTAARPR